MSLEKAMQFKRRMSGASEASNHLPVFFEKFQKPGSRLKGLIPSDRHALEEKL